MLLSFVFDNVDLACSSQLSSFSNMYSVTRFTVAKTVFQDRKRRSVSKLDIFEVRDGPSYKSSFQNSDHVLLRDLWLPIERGVNGTLI